MSIVYYGTYPKAVFSWDNSILSYVSISYYKSTSPSNITTITNLTGTTYTTGDLSSNTTYTFTLTPYNISNVAGTSKQIVLNTTPNTSTRYSTNTYASYVQLKWSGTYTYVNISRASAVGSSGTLGSYSNIATTIYDSSYYDTNLKGNTTYSYIITPYLNGAALSSSKTTSFYINVQAVKDFSSTYVDTSSITLSFATPQNSYTSVSYIACAISTTDGSFNKTTGTSSPLIVKGLTSGKTYNCYIITQLDNDSSLIGVSNYSSVKLS